MKVIELFETIHGELPAMGAPVTIVRFQECNLSCFYCDADLSVKPRIMSPMEVYHAIQEFGNRHVLLTGGEPLLEPQLNVLLKKLSSEYEVTIETNGTLDVGVIDVPCSIVMDVKLDQPWGQEIANVEVLNTMDAIKFVYWDQASFDRAWEFITDYIADHYPAQIIFSPVDTQVAFVPEFIQRCKAYSNIDFRMQVQIHKILKVG